jgi:hypothetical protein
MCFVVVVAVTAVKIPAAFHLAFFTDGFSAISTLGHGAFTARQTLIRPGRSILNFAIRIQSMLMHTLAPFPRKPVHKRASREPALCVYPARIILLVPAFANKRGS